ncbi:hypothetical protein J8L88_14700 [Aquimarina sp. MMG015]|uniref:hypothetical protein n=1 Tax=unclassified Aquimarina TaxID=2627091 RepID=UPI000D55AB09|nr:MULTISPECIES: hypothetical protein [unclassified Aquimarina]MBQ4804109.1 hypothetical protein [Aquimarina sp. MMG015]
MKKTYVFALASLMLAAVSCSDDDSNPGIVTVTPDPTEEISLNPDDVSGGIIIDNGTQVSGNAPTPTGTLPFSLDETSQSGFQKNGFDITFDAPSNYAGAYIQVQSEDGTAADEYWDVSIPGRSNVTSSEEKRKGLFSEQTNRLNDQEIEIDVDFEDNVSAGTFCYLICIYDTDGNISQPVEVCVEVEAWGGNPNLIGTWNYTKRTRNGVTEDTIGAEECDETTVFCANDTELLVENAYCDTLLSLPITFNADGTYTYVETTNYTNLDYEATRETCTATFETEAEELYSSRGNWAYDEEEGKLTLVEFEYTETVNGDPSTGIEENGYLLFDGKATVTDSLIIEGDYDDDQETYTAEFHFNR